MEKEKIALQDRMWFKNLSFVLTLFATIVSVFAAMPQIKSYFHKPVHNMEISIPDFNVNDNVLVNIPYGDYRLQKTILNKIIHDD